MQTIGRPVVVLIGSASAIKSEFGRLIASNGGCARSHSESLSSSFVWKPERPRSIETVSAPSSLGSLEMAPDEAARISAGWSQSLSRNGGVWRKNDIFCSRYTLMPPKKMRSSLRFASSVKVGV